MSGPCMCGALDCPSCYDGDSDGVDLEEIFVARWVKKGKKVRQCESCPSQIYGKHLYVFGTSESGTPQGYRFCLTCGGKIEEGRQ